MDAIFISGESINNKAWIEAVEKTLHSFFGQTKILYYDHWQSGKEAIDLDIESAKLPANADGLDPYIVFAKSIGSVLTLRGITEQTLTPQKCFFVGPAFLVGENYIPEFKGWIQDFKIPSIILCKTNDPVAPAEQIRELLQRYNVQNYEFVEIPGDNHKYEDLENIKKIVDRFINT